MAIYTVLNKSDVQNILKPYGLEVEEFHAATGGKANSNYYLKTNKGKYLLTIAEEKSKAELKELAEILKWLNQHGFSTSKVITTLKDKILTKFKRKPVMLKKWIKGKVHLDIAPSSQYHLGKTMAKLHQVPVPKFLSAQHGYGLEVIHPRLEESYDLTYQKWLSKELGYLKANLPSQLKKGLIHGDLFFDNVVFKKSHLPIIIDFEMACYYYLTFDIGMAIVGSCQTKGKIDWEKVKAFIKGYETVKPLKKKERKSIVYFIRYAAVGTSYYRFWKYHIHTPSPEKRDEPWQMVRLVKQLEKEKKKAKKAIKGG